MTMDAARKAKIWKRTQVGGGLAGALVLLLWLASFSFGPLLVLSLAAVLSVAGAWELARMGVPHRGATLWGMVLMTAAAIVWLLRSGLGGALPLQSGDLAWILWCLLPLPMLISAAAYGRAAHGPTREGHGIHGLFAAVWVSVPLLLLYPVRLLGGVSALAALMVLSKIGDIAGYYAGNFFGKSHPVPRLSPGKTTAGCVGSFAAGTLAGLLLQAGGTLPGAPQAGLPWLWAGALAGALINIAAQAGDLYESYWKRRTGVKDSGTWFGPSGGVLDLVDSLLFTAPVAAITWPALFGWSA
ncbi:MAG: phosphatidate cytidylyltransferase [Planctomycetota bacterium]